VTVRVLRGDPTAEEIAALVAVLSSLPRAVAEPPGAAVVGGWMDRRAALRFPMAPGPGAWVSSGRIRGLRTRAAW
jgi:hypothetical protein